jgi:excisionase family DNA binding protein
VRYTVEEKFYTIKQVAELFSVHRTTVYDWMNAGKLAYVQVGERRRIQQSALETFIKAGHPGMSEAEAKEDGEGITIPGLVAA